MIGLHEDIALDTALAGLPEEAKQILDRRYKNAAKRLVRHRFDTLYKNMGTTPELNENDVAHYTLIDLKNLAARLYGDAFAKWFEDNNKATDFLFRLAEETGVVLLPGKDFEVVDPSARVSPANLTEHDYASIGKFSRRVIDEYNADFAAETGTGQGHAK